MLELEPAHGLLVPLGVALDDHLDGSRDEVDALARRNFAAWRATVPLDFEGLDPADALELELMTRVFMPAPAWRSASAGHGRDRYVGGRAPGPGLARVASALAEEAGLAVRHDAVEVPSRRVRRGLTDRAFSFAGVPGRPRGSVACVSYWHLKPVIARLVAEGPTPVAAGVILPGLDRRDTLSAFVRGGMLGHPGPWSQAPRRADSQSAALVGPGGLRGPPPRAPLTTSRATSSRTGRPNCWCGCTGRSMRLQSVPCASPWCRSTRPRSRMCWWPRHDWRDGHRCSFSTDSTPGSGCRTSAGLMWRRSGRSATPRPSRRIPVPARL